MGGAIQFSVDWQGYVPSVLFTWGQTMTEVMKIMASSFKRSHAHTVTLNAPNSAAGHRQPTPLPETPGHSQASLGQSLVVSLLVSSGSWCTQDSVCTLQEIISQSCVSSGGSVVGLMVVFSKRTYAMPKSVAPRATVPVAVHCCPTPPQETLKHSLSQSLWGPWVLVHPRFV